MKISLPRFSFRLSVMERLLRCRFCISKSCREPKMLALGSLPGVGSILITSAPKSASWRTHVGPERTRDRSSTRKRERAEEAGWWGMEILRKEGAESGTQSTHFNY